MVSTKNMPVRRLRGRLCLCGPVLAALIGGCATSGASLVDCPLSPEQQQQAVLEIVPRGTSRVDAEGRLRKAGIEFSPGQKNSIYYLGLWKRPDGKRWHIKVALLFDQEGKLYQTRPADSATEPLTNENQSKAWRRADSPGINSPGINSPGINSPGINSPGANSAGANSTAVNGSGADGAAGDSRTIREDELQIPWPDEADSTKRRR